MITQPWDAAGRLSDIMREQQQQQQQQTGLEADWKSSEN